MKQVQAESVPSSVTEDVLAGARWVGWVGRLKQKAES